MSTATSNGSFVQEKKRKPNLSIGECLTPREFTNQTSGTPSFRTTESIFKNHSNFTTSNYFYQNKIKEKNINISFLQYKELYDKSAGKAKTSCNNW